MHLLDSAWSNVRETFLKAEYIFSVMGEEQINKHLKISTSLQLSAFNHTNSTFFHRNMREIKQRMAFPNGNAIN